MLVWPYRNVLNQIDMSENVTGKTAIYALETDYSLEWHSSSNFLKIENALLPSSSSRVMLDVGASRSTGQSTAYREVSRAVGSSSLKTDKKQ